MLVVSVLIFLPYLTTLVLAAAFAVLFRPVYLWFLKLTRKHESISALLTMFVVLLVIVLPLLLLGSQMALEAAAVYDALLEGQELGVFLAQAVTYIESTFGVSLSEQFTDIEQLQKYAQPVLTWIVDNASGVVSSITTFVIRLVIGMMAFYFILRDGSTLRKRLTDISPLKDKQDTKIFSTMKASINSVLRGALVLAIVQGAIAGIGYAIFGVPNPVLLGGLTAIAALIPGIGTAIALVPIILYLLIAKGLGAAIGLTIWGLIAVGLVDNILGPKLWGKGIKVHSVLILISVLGGIQLFGPIGIILGPLMISLLFALIEILPVITQSRQRS